MLFAQHVNPNHSPLAIVIQLANDAHKLSKWASLYRYPLARSERPWARYFYPSQFVSHFLQKLTRDA
jgi:hypothetical protein